jgi:hypothetical protein
MTKQQEREREEAREELRGFFKPGDTIYTVLRHRSASGMYRVIDAFVMRDNEPRRISYTVAKAIGFRYDERHEGVGVGGCGMDVGFEVVYNLGYALFPNGFDCVGEHCPSNDHRNRVESMHHTEGGYALTQRWM